MSAVRPGRGSPSHGLAAWLRVGVVAASLAPAASGLRAADGEAPGEYLLLENKFGELCTMCEATVLCRNGEVSGIGVADLDRPQTAPYTLYHFHTKTFWGQVGTIWDYLVRWVEPVTTEQRPVSVYAVDDYSGKTLRGGLTETMGILSLDPARIDVGQHTIDRRTGEWRDADGTRAGYCVRLPLRDTYRFLKSNAGWEPASRG